MSRDVHVPAAQEASNGVLGRLARREREARSARERAAAQPEERCDLCAQPVPPRHRHLLDMASRRPLCACRACATLFDRAPAGDSHYRLVPERRRRIADFDCDDPLWRSLGVPVSTAFFVTHGDGSVVGLYPGPMGATDARVDREAWERLRTRNGVVATIEADVEALLVDRRSGEGRAWIVPIDDCFALMGLLRTHWRGLSGGRELWAEVQRFFGDLDAKAERVERGRREDPPGASGPETDSNSHGRQTCPES